tara:strand:- start:26352 stop:27179 length:828 start_codon:yes stop_codon:yes gene_type:complete
MKVDRIITTLNSNPLYADFWNIFSPIWNERFNLRPTLIYVGSAEELSDSNLSKDHGDIIRVDRVDAVTVSAKPDWSVTWALKWGASQFPNDVCVTSGIDEIDLSDFYFDLLKDIDEEKYVIGFDDAYEGYTPDTLGYHSNIPHAFYPTSHLSAKGSTFKKIFNIEDRWEDEITKVFSHRGNYTLPPNLWGLDECYASHCIDSYSKNVDDSVFVKLGMFRKQWLPRRIDRGLHLRGGKFNYDPEALKNGHYTELIAPRPYSHYKQAIDSLLADFLK